jgi:hypothetical protein
MFLHRKNYVNDFPREHYQMANINDSVAQRKGSYGANAPNGYPVQNYGYPASQAQALRTAPYIATANPMMQHAHGDSVAALAHGFGAMALQHPSFGSANRSNSQMTAAATMANEYPSAGAIHSQGFYLPAGQQMNYIGGHIVPSSTATQSSSTMYPQVGHYMQQSNYPTGYMSQVGTENNHSQSWSSRVPSDGSHTMPTLITPRRGSVSSNEDHVPATPFHAYGYNGVAILDRSPSGVFTSNTTPSPSSYVQQYGALPAKPYANPPIPVQMQMLLNQEPAIPRAIPAPSSPAKPLDRCLENKNGETNVYIRGLLPETTDEMLQAWGTRFGDIASSKSIIDHKTGLCKGYVYWIQSQQHSLTVGRFGFIKFHNFDDAENCIRGFHHLGYEVSFARVRHMSVFSNNIADNSGIILLEAQEVCR